MAISAPPASPARGYQWLHGSGEAAILSRQTYEAFARAALAAQAARQRGEPVESAILAEDASPATPRWIACGTKPSAVVLDMDETAILNTGANYDSAWRGDPPFDPARWNAWERDSAPYVDPVPGAVAAVAAIRAAGITPIFISNRIAGNAAGARDALVRAGLGDAALGRTLFLRADATASGGKDARRAAVARDWCVLAMIGDQLGDFSDLFNARGRAPADRRAFALAPAVDGIWGRGWFLLPNPLYGPGVTGGFDDIFPADRRWPGPPLMESK